MGEDMYQSMQAGVKKDNLWKFILSLYVGPRNYTQVVKLSGKYLYPLRQPPCQP